MKKSFIHHSFYSKRKRVFDFSLAILLAIISFFPALLLFPILLFLIGKPILYRQKRTGIQGKDFWILKLRRMKDGAEKEKSHYKKVSEAPWPMFKLSQDPRSLQKIILLPSGKKIIIQVGDLLSRTGIDEFPQLWNILKGEMSFFGPRPLPKEEAEKLKEIDLDWWEWRQSVRPGIFSIWALKKAGGQKLYEWKKFEKESLKLTLSLQILTSLKICLKQISQIVR